MPTRIPRPTTLLLDLIERMAIMESTAKFADLQRLEIAHDVKKLASAAQVQELEKKMEHMEQQLVALKAQVHGHDTIFSAGRRLGGAIWGAISGLAVAGATLLVERWVRGGN